MLYDALGKLWRIRGRGRIYLSPAPLYHAAPHAGVNLKIREGGTAIITERFDAEQFPQLVEAYKVTHTQLCLTMFSRMLKLPVRFKVPRSIDFEDERPWPADRKTLQTPSLEIDWG